MDSLAIEIQETALVVIDLQKGIIAIPVQPHSAAQVISNAAKLAEVFRQKQRPVFLVHVTPSADGKDGLKPIADAPIQRPQALPPDWAEIVPELGPKPGDFIITKRQWGAFHGTELDLQLRRRGIQTIVLCGIATNMGVESTARFAYDYGYQQIFVEDAMSARSKEEHEHPIKTALARIGRIRSTQQIIAAFCS